VIYSRPGHKYIMELVNQNNLISSFINETCSLFESQIEFNRYCMSYHHSVSEKFQNLKILGETLLKMNNCTNVPIPKPTNPVFAPFTPSISPPQTQPHQRLNSLDSDYNKNKNRTGQTQVLNSMRANLNMINNENERFAQQRQNQASYYTRHITPESDHYTINTNNTNDNTNKENRHSEDNNSNGYQSSNEQYNIKNESIETIETNHSYSTDTVHNNGHQNGFIDTFNSATDAPMTSSSMNDGYPSQEDSYSMEFNRVISEQDLSAIDHAKPFKCTECHKTFRMKEELKIHFRVHSGERPFKCNQCDKCFKQSTDLKRHILVHTGEKKYRCPQCGKHFTLLGNMRLHQRRIHPINSITN